MAPGIADKKNNTLPLWGNDKTMNLNNLILTNIQSSHYFKVNLYQLKTYHEVIDEIYFKVNHLEPWEKGSRKTAGQTGMCGGVRGVGAGGIVSTAFCILYKLFTLKLTRKQVVGLINHIDSPHIRALGFMYIRYTQPPADLWEWYEHYLDDDEELDVKAGGGQVMTIGEMLCHFLSKLEWFSTLFPRIPVPVQKDLERKLSNRRANAKTSIAIVPEESEPAEPKQSVQNHWEEEGHSRRNSSRSRDSGKNAKDSRSRDEITEDAGKERDRSRRERHDKSSKHHHSSSKRNKHSSRRSTSNVNKHARHRTRSPSHENYKYSSHRVRSQSPSSADYRHSNYRTRSPVELNSRSSHRVQSRSPSSADYRHSNYRTRSSVDRDFGHTSHRTRSPVEVNSRYSHRVCSRSPSSADYKHSNYRTRSSAELDSRSSHRMRSRSPSSADYKHSNYQTHSSADRDSGHTSYRTRSPVELDSRYPSHRSRSPVDHRHRNHHRY
ncbi:hypothetical protein CEXT_52511 [Caerostris extrusa]|uniref:Pre-mRNA-splicing factor 38 n=1 Tax=Caerostris extrusa TaxID=172846 RepID=A0AAV4NGP3_CAEEX|nr:hypothetical protein CEXT_52511 [Caerostris extrusa]